MGKKPGNLSKLRRRVRAEGREGALLCVCLGTLGGIGVLLGLLSFFAALLASFPLPLSLFAPAGLLIGIAGAGASGFFCALLRREKGFYLGIACGLLLFCILQLLAHFSWGEPLGPQTLLRLSTLCLAAAVGGMWGVNI